MTCILQGMIFQMCAISLGSDLFTSGLLPAYKSCPVANCGALISICIVFEPIFCMTRTGLDRTCYPTFAHGTLTVLTCIAWERSSVRAVLLLLKRCTYSLSDEGMRIVCCYALPIGYYLADCEVVKIADPSIYFSF